MVKHMKRHDGLKWNSSKHFSLLDKLGQNLMPGYMVGKHDISELQSQPDHCNSEHDAVSYGWESSVDWALHVCMGLPLKTNPVSSALFCLFMKFQFVMTFNIILIAQLASLMFFLDVVLYKFKFTITIPPWPWDFCKNVYRDICPFLQLNLPKLHIIFSNYSWASF